MDYDLSDKLLESLAWKAGPKIAELWNLSETAGGRLTEVIHWGQYILFGEKIPYGEDDYFRSLVIVANMKDPKAIRKLSREEYEYILKNTTIASHKALDRLSCEGALVILSLVNKLSSCGVKVSSYQES